MMLRAMAALLAPTARAMPWGPFLVAGGFGLAVVVAPAVTGVVLSVEDLTGFLRVAAVSGALGAAFLLDDPAAASIAVAPTPRLTRHALRAGIALAPLSIWWAVLLAVTVAGAEQGSGAALPLRDLTLEAGAIVATAFGLAAAYLRWSSNGIGGLGAAASVPIGMLALSVLPERVALLVAPADPRWEAAHHRWALLLAAALILLLWSSRGSVARHRPLGRRSAGAAGTNP